MMVRREVAEKFIKCKSLPLERLTNRAIGNESKSEIANFVASRGKPFCRQNSVKNFIFWGRAVDTIC